MSSEEIHDKRELGKIGLSTYLDEITLAHLDSITDNLCKELEANLDNSYKEIYQSHLNNEHYNFEDTYYKEEQLLAIQEIKIIHLYRNFEVIIKKLLRAAYNIDISKMYRWNNVEVFLSEKKIDYKNIPYYEEVNNLRLVNNHLKHWVDGEKSKIDHISELNGNEIRQIDLLNFYNNTKDKPLIWFFNLRDKIYDNLYVFDADRINNISEYFALRMDKDTADKFIKKLLEKY
ncbi:MAG: hypothetical protein AB8B52_09325 [Winogradskyella sp.]|uniref:hypothetical protein n=1 Tax=Winogradskyella sp. TaxID=1883156 RepID=UPI00385FB0E1